LTLAFGHSSVVQAEWETTYGTLASGTSWKALPVVSWDPGISQPWERLDVVNLAGGRDDPDPVRGLLTVEPAADVPIDLVNIGYWLRLMFGDPVTTGTTNLTHVFTSGGTTPRSLSVEHGNAAVANGFQQVLGVRGNTMEIQFRPGEVQQTARFGMVARGAPARVSSSADASPTLAAFTPFTGPLMTATRSGSALGRVTGATLRFSNGLEVLREANRAGGAITEAAPGVTEVTGSVDVRLDDEVILGDSEGAAAVALAFGYSLSGTQALTFEVPEAYLTRAGMPVRGRAGIQASFSFRGAFNASAAAALRVTLLNQQAAYT
jgi:hypothetical protein